MSKICPWIYFHWPTIDFSAINTFFLLLFYFFTAIIDRNDDWNNRTSTNFYVHQEFHSYPSSKYHNNLREILSCSFVFIHLKLIVGKNTKQKPNRIVSLYQNQVDRSMIKRLVRQKQCYCEGINHILFNSIFLDAPVYTQIIFCYIDI